MICGSLILLLWPPEHVLFSAATIFKTAFVTLHNINLQFPNRTTCFTSPCSSLNIVVCCATVLATEMCSHQVILDALLTLKGDAPSCCARQATKPSVMAVLCTNVNKDIKNNSSAHLHVGALMNPHLYSHTLISNSDKAPPPNTHMHSAQPFSRG